MPTTASIQEAVDLVRRWQDAGGTHAAVRSMGLGFKSVDQYLDYLADFRFRLS